MARINLFYVAEQIEALESILPCNNNFFLTVNTPIEMWCKHSVVKDRMSWSSMQWPTLLNEPSVNGRYIQEMCKVSFEGRNVWFSINGRVLYDVVVRNENCEFCFPNLQSFYSEYW